jgi:WD40 repeat protein
MLASAGDDITIRLWDVATGNELQTLVGHTQTPLSLAFSPDGATLASADRGRGVRLWTLSLAGEVAATPTRPPTGPSPTPLPLSARAISVANAAQVKTLNTLDSLGGVVAWSPDGTGLVVGGSEVYFLDAATLKPVRSIKSYSGNNGLAISPDGKTLAIFRTGVRLYDTTSGGELRTLFEQSSVSSATCGAPLAFSPDSATLAVQVGDTVKLYDVASGQELDTIVAKGASSVAFAADGKSLYVGTWQGGIRLDVSTGQPLFSFGGPLGDGSCLALSADGTLLATAGFSGNVVTLRDAATGRQLRTFNGHTAGVTRLAFSPDGRMLASAGDDITIRLWDVATGNELQTLVGHTQTPLSLSFSPDGATLASADRGRGVHLWGIKP